MRAGTAAVLDLPKHAVLRFLVGHYFHKYFEAVPSVSDELKEAVFRIRFDVYCRELGWEDPSNFPDQLESDAYDADALHVLLYHKPSRTFAGTVRLVRTSSQNPGRPLPFELSCAETLYPEAKELLASRRLHTGEISRLAVRAQFRRRLGETAPVGDVPDSDGSRRGKNQRRTPPIAMSLYVAAACSGLEAGLDSVFALMEPRLASRLNHYGIHFRQMGGPIDHRGIRAPFYITRQALFDGIDPKARALLDVITRDLRKGARRG